MGLKYLKNVSEALLVTALMAFPLLAQNARVEVGKHSRAIPKVCESVVPASIPAAGAGEVEIPALVKEAICKGAGDMLIDYTFVTNSSKRAKDKKGEVREERTTYEVFIPTLKSGMHTRGILVVTSHNGIPVPPKELEKERLRAAERIEKEEDKIARATPTPTGTTANSVQGMLPLGMYTSTGITREAFGVKRGSVVLSVQTFLKTCELTLARREQIEGRETLIFKFAPRPDAQFADNEKYIAQLGGEIWIDARDRIVSRLVGWPVSEPLLAAASAKDSEATNKSAPAGAAGERPPAVYVEMMRLRERIWLPRVNRINGADYPTLFDGITTDSTSTYSNYIRFSTDVKDVKLEPPNPP